MTSPIPRRWVLGAGAAAGFGAAFGLWPTSAARAAESALRPQLAFLNHTYAVLPAELAEAIGANDYLKEFGAFSERTTSNGTTTYTGRYLTGRQTYLEMFPAGALPAPDDAVGVTGVALSPDRAGRSDLVKARLVSLGVSDPVDQIQTKLIDGPTGSEPVPWFRIVAPTLTYAACFPWVMEYLQSYFADPRTATEPAGFAGDVSRERYNPDTYRDRLMRDVVAVEFAAPATDVAALRLLFRAAGLHVTDRDFGLVAVGRSEVVVVRRAARVDAGWQRIVFALNRSVGRPHTETIGPSRLRVGPGPQAVWTF